MNMAVVVMVVVVHDWHAFQRGMQSQTDQGGPCRPSVKGWSMTSMFMGVAMAMFDALRQKFEESLKQETADPKRPAKWVASYAQAQGARSTCQ